VSNAFYPFMGVSIPFSIFTPGTVPVKVSYTLVVFGIAYYPQAQSIYTHLCGAPIYIPVHVTVTNPLTFFETDCSPLAGSMASPAFQYNQTLIIDELHPPSAMSFDLVFLNVPATIGILMGDLTITASDNAVYTFTRIPCDLDDPLPPATACKCNTCCSAR
jgi:hypothetical protein